LLPLASGISPDLPLEGEGPLLAGQALEGLQGSVYLSSMEVAIAGSLQAIGLIELGASEDQSRECPCPAILLEVGLPACEVALVACPVPEDLDSREGLVLLHCELQAGSVGMDLRSLPGEIRLL